MEIKCTREGCGYKWDYKGKKKSKLFAAYVSCPQCRTSVKVQK